MRRTILLILCSININSFGVCDSYRAIFDDGKNGEDKYLNSYSCYDGTKIKTDKGENSWFGKGGDGGNVYIPKDTVISNVKINTGKGGDSIFGKGGNGGGCACK